MSASRPPQPSSAAGAEPPDRAGSARGKVARGCAIAAAALTGGVGVAVLLGWILDLPGLRTFGGTVAMQPNSALGVMLLATGLAVIALNPQRRFFRVIAWAGVAVAAGVSALTLFEYAAGVDVGIDGLLLPETAQSTQASLHPGRSAPNTALAIVFVALALALGGRPRRRLVADGLVVGAFFVGFLAFLGYLYGARVLTGLASLTPMALPSVVAVLALAAGAMVARPDDGMASILTSPLAGGHAVRRLLPAILVVPVVIGWLRLVGEARGHYDVPFGLSMIVASTVMILGAAAWWSGSAIDRLQRERERLRDELEAELRRLNARLGEAVHVRDEFLDLAAHELRTPLTALRLAFDRLRRSVGDAGHLRLEPDELRQRLEPIDRGARRVEHLAERLLAASTLLGGVTPDRELVELRALVEAVVVEHRRELEASGSQVRIDGEAELAVPGERAWIEMIVRELVGNAVKFGAGRRIEVRLERQPARARLIVRDYGPGTELPGEQAAFERFARGVSLRNFGGFGFGLWMVRQIARAHGGRAELASRVGEGTRVTVDLPLDHPPEPTAEADDDQR